MNNLVTGKVRFSYTRVFEPGLMPNGEERYSATLLIPKSDTVTYQNIMNAINACLQENLATTFKGVMPANPRMPIYDGDGLRESGDPFGEECKGHWVLSAKSKTAPDVVDQNVQPIISKSEFYSGCYGRASISFYAYSKNGNKGIGCGLGNVQKLEDGQPLGGRTTAAEDFGTPVPNMGTPIQNATSSLQNMISPMQNLQQPIQPLVSGFQVDPITGQPLVAPTMNSTMGQQPTINNIYGVN